uniref:5-hydroxytryptamine receptor 3A-like n=1 Tax=Leptobrachium leishanense TaxID=445787 RepID=A0A8C5PDG6_9ANUR
MLSLLLMFTFAGVRQCQQKCDYYNLQKNLTDSISISVRPTRNWLDTSFVKVDLRLYTVIYLNMKEQSISMFIWLKVSWKNDFLSWNPDDFCGIKQMKIPDTGFWKPDIYISELIETSDKPIVIPYVTVQYDGTVIQARPMRIVSTCYLDIYKFPFDSQTCTVKLGSFVYSDYDMIIFEMSDSFNVTKNSKDIYFSTEDWNLVSISVSTLTEQYLEGPRYSLVLYKISIQRIPTKYVVNLVIPTIFMLLMDCFSMFIKSYEDRLGFKITVVLGFSVLLLLLNDLLPNSEKSTILGIFCCASVTLMVFSIAGCVLTSLISRMSTKPYRMPKWMKMYCLKNIAPLVCVKLHIAKPDQEAVIPVDIENCNVTNTKFQLEIFEKKKNGKRLIKDILRVNIFKKLLSVIVKIREQQNEPINEDDAESEWHSAALVLDRLIRVLYFMFIIALFLILIISWVK